MTKDLDLVQRVDTIHQYCAGKSVLHLGCTNYPYTQAAIDSNSLLHFELERICSEIYGFDSDPVGLDMLRGHGSTNLYLADLEHLGKLDLEKTFDVIVAGEMIEHLNNPGLFLDGIKRFMNGDSILVLTTINAYCGMRFIRYGLTRGVGQNEPVHPDHVAYYSYSTLKLTLSRHNLDVERFLFYDLGKEHRVGMPLIFRVINDVCVRFARQWSDGVIAVCRLGQEK